MSDMPRPGLHPSAAVHEQHDALLLAQFAAGDSLGETQQREARELVSSCVACASLASDLRAISRAVAWEPPPPRRRDFRIDADQAERLTGNAFTRFLRRLSLPQARAFQPAAAGMLSIGLAFVVAGYAWPDGGTVSVGDEGSAAPAAIEEHVASTPATIEERAPAAATSAGRAAARSPSADAEAGDVSPVENPVFSGAEAEFLEGLAEHQAGTSARENARKSLEAEMADDAEAIAGAADAFVTEAAPEEAFEPDAVDPAELSGVEPPAPASIADDQVTETFGEGAAKKALDRNEIPPAEPEAAAEADAEAVGESFWTESTPADALGIENGDAVEPKGIADDDVLDVLGVVVDGASESDAQDQVAVIAPVDDGLALESLLVAIGLGLALLGALLLLLVWFARRSADPLLR